MWRRRALAAASCGALIPASARARTPANFRRGVSTWPWFALTREYPAPRRDYAWAPFQPQRPVPTASDLRRLRATGLDFVRIPVDPGPFLAFAGAQRAALTDQLFDAIAQCLAADLSVIVNIQANGATHYWNPSQMFAAPEAPEWHAYLDLAEALARRLGRLDPALVALEPVNEPPQGCASGIWHEMQSTLLARARQAAPALTLVATGACGSMVAGLIALDPAPLRPLAPLLFTFHFYEPYLFSHQGAPWMREPIYRDLNSVPWPASAGSLERTLAAVRARMAADTGITADAKRDAYRQIEKVLGVYFAAQPARPFLEHYLASVAAWGAHHRIPAHQILMGEFGALRTDRRYTAAADADRARYVRDVRETAERFRYGWAFWNLFDGMGLMDDTTRALDPAMIAALGLVLPAT
jgi:hypothetical protein